MKKILFYLMLLSTVMTTSLIASVGMGYTINSHAYCECDGSITFTGYLSACVWWCDSTQLEVEEWDGTAYVNKQIYDKRSYDPSVHSLSVSYTLDNLCPGKYRFSYRYNHTGTDPVFSMNRNTGSDPDYLEVIIEGPDEFLTASIVSVVNGSCSGSGSATIATTGGNGGNTIVWKKNGIVIPEGDGQTYLGNLTDGSYTVTITDSKGCSKTLTFTIDNTYDPIEYDLEFTNSGCNGEESGEFKLCNVTPAGTFVSNAWSADYDPIEKDEEGNCNVYSGAGGATIWHVTLVSPYGCTVVLDIPIAEFPELIITPIVKQSGCDGGTSSGRIELDITSGTAPYTYEWSHNSSLNSNIADGLSPGTYTVTVTDANGCEKTFEISITQVPELVLGVHVRDVNVSGNCCSEATALVSGGTKPYTIVWTGGNTSTDGKINTICTFPATHTVTVTDAMGCTYTEVVTNTSCGGGNIPVPYPNPNTGQFDIDFTIPQLSEVVFELYDGFVKVKTKNNGTLSAGAHTINWNTSLSPGMYTLVIWTDGHIEHEGVLVQIQ
ncbi:MAG: hypothetical protein H6615_04240 [Ignavibacteria bacterium]|nr:hypothetical protein [Ignavibacteria bacterium]